MTDMVESVSEDKTYLPVAYAPLRRELFRAIWFASLASNIGTWIQNVGAAWLMTGMSTSPFLVASVQAATTLPVFLIGLPAGALADIVDRRQLLLFAQGWMLVSAGVLAALTAANLVTPTVLLLLTFSLGLGFALNGPAWQAVIPELVPRDELQAAVGLNGVSMNASRAVGPAIGGLIVAMAGPSAAFIVNAISFVAVLVVIYRWNRVVEPSSLPAERLIGAMRAGIRYVRHSAPVRAVLVRNVAFVTGASALWALLPIFVRANSERGPGSYGILLGCVGIGAVAITFVLPSARNRWGAGRLLIAATVAYAAATAVIATVPSFALWCGMLVPVGAAWLVGLTSLSVAVQSIVPAWVRARVIAVYLLVFYGGLTGGSIAWGLVAHSLGAGSSLLLASAWMICGLLTAIHYGLPEGPLPDVEPSHHWPDAPEITHGDGPVLVQVEFLIRESDVFQFLRAAQPLRAIRLRDGALRWDLFEDAEQTGRFVESFLVESWTEHLRQHDRVSGADRVAEAAVRVFHASERPPRVTHLVSAVRLPRDQPLTSQQITEEILLH